MTYVELKSLEGYKDGDYPIIPFVECTRCQARIFDEDILVSHISDEILCEGCLLLSGMGIH